MTEIELAMRKAWEDGFRLCRTYGDNHHHWDGEQRELCWKGFLESLADKTRCRDCGMKTGVTHRPWCPKFKDERNVR